MTQGLYDNENGVYVHHDSLHNMDSEINNAAMTDKQFEQRQGKHDKCTCKEIDHDDGFAKHSIDQGAGVNRYPQERGRAKCYDTT